MKDRYTELLQSALEAMRGYRQEHGDYQPCDTEKAIAAVLAKQSVTPKSVKTEQSAEVFTMLCCGIECPKCGTSFTVKASQPAPIQQALVQFNAAIDFAIEQGAEGAEFLRCWREGDTSDWPEFTGSKT